MFELGAGMLLVALVALLTSGALWDRFRQDPPMERYLRTPGLVSLCEEYLGYVTGMTTEHDQDVIRYLDSQRQVTHNELLRRLGLTRDHVFDMTRFARRYLDQHGPSDIWEGGVDE